MGKKTSNEKGSADFNYGSTLRPILLVYDITKIHPPFGLGFFTNKTSVSSSVLDSGFYLVVFMMTGVNISDSNSDGEYQFSPRMPPQVLWSANRDSPVGENATLDFTAEGDLVLRDGFGNPVWSTNTSTDYVAQMEIDVSGNFMLQNGSNSVVWQSFDNPTDTWLPNQKIYNGQRLTASNLPSNLSTGIYYLSVDKDYRIGMQAFLDSNAPQEYAKFLAPNTTIALAGPALGSADNAVVLTTTFAVFRFNFTASPTDFWFIVLEPNGHLVLYCVNTSYQHSFAVTPRSDLLAVLDSLGDCSYPTVCGHCGVCSSCGQCACPQGNNGTSNYFWPFEQDECKEACLNNCSCKAALFRFDTDVSFGNCSLQSDELYSFTPSAGNFSSYASIKVQKVASQKKLASPILVLPLVGVLLIVTFIGGMCYCCRILNTDIAEEETDDQVTESSTKFSFEELNLARRISRSSLAKEGMGLCLRGS
ncbi:hypothetical protein RHSIM_Rhsim06G0209800 [Rhododendron simsii]|uniref:Bulb-type lectin domain-containing protein n=1 Tax=Rhododendron simsii TaxID=118357 RepID=A0A834GSG4_RHOSS|nr:hypothetical protein RHSIM_Rhsim06G0209800 [Rhododendron simsii]